MTIMSSSPSALYVLSDVAKLAMGLWFSQSTNDGQPLLLAVLVLFFLNTHRLAAILVAQFESTPETPTNGTVIVALHKRILCVLTLLFVADIFTTYVIAMHLKPFIAPYALLCAIFAVGQPARLWRTFARYAVESFDRYAATTGLAQSRKCWLVGVVDVCYHAFQLVNAIAFAALIALYYRASPSLPLRRNAPMLIVIAAQLIVQLALDAYGVARQLIRFHRQAGYIHALVRRLPVADKSHSDAMCTICRETNEDGGDEKQPLQTQLACSHAFHRECLLAWFAWSLHCPICRTACVTSPEDNVAQTPLLSPLPLYT